MQKFKLFLLTIFFIISISSIAQTTLPSDSLQKVLSTLSLKIWKQKSDSLKIKYNKEFVAVFYEAIKNPANKSNLFDSVVGITECHTDKRSLQLFTWNIPLANGTFIYHGYIRTADTSNPILELKSEPSLSRISTNEILTKSNWYGALYYSIIEQKINGKIAYTLLGWDGADNSLNRKVIDIISFNDNSTVLFGMPVFKTEKGTQHRIVFEYAEKANCTLRYDFQAINVEKGRKIKKQKHWMIIFDRLIPMDPSLKGMTKYYVPSGDIYDGFLFKDGFWRLVEEIDVRNEKTVTGKPKSGN